MMENEAARIMQPDYPNTPDEFTDKWGYAKATGDVGLKIFENDLQRILEAATQAETARCVGILERLKSSDSIIPTSEAIDALDTAIRDILAHVYKEII